MFRKADSGTAPLDLQPENAPDMEVPPDDDDHDEVFSSPLPLSVLASPMLMNTRVRSVSPASTPKSGSSHVSQASFLKIPVRFGRKTLNPKDMVAAVHVSAKYEISLSATVKVMVDV